MYIIQLLLKLLLQLLLQLGIITIRYYNNYHYNIVPCNGYFAARCRDIEECSPETARKKTLFSLHM